MIRDPPKMRKNRKKNGKILIFVFGRFIAKTLVLANGPSGKRLVIKFRVEWYSRCSISTVPDPVRDDFSFLKKIIFLFSSQRPFFTQICPHGTPGMSPFDSSRNSVSIRTIGIFTALTATRFVTIFLFILRLFSDATFWRTILLLLTPSN